MNRNFTVRQPQPPQPRTYNQSGHGNFMPRTAWNVRPFQNPQQQQNNPVPLRPWPKPLPKPEPMDVDGSTQSRAVNYMNRPGPSRFPIKRPSNLSQQVSTKFQRNFHIMEGTDF